MTAFIIGNGPSRRNIDLSKLSGDTYGCNLLFNEFIPTVLVSCDLAISNHIQLTSYPKYHTFYSRHAFKSSGALHLSRHYRSWSSGSNAVQLAISAKHKEIVLIGFDFNNENIISDTVFYKTPTNQIGNRWLSEILSLVKINHRIKFIFVTSSTANNSKISKFKNTKIIKKEEFIKMYASIKS